MKYGTLKKPFNNENEITTKSNTIKITEFSKSDYAYLIPWDDYYAPAFLYKLQKEGIIVKTAMKSATVYTNNKETTFDRGTLLIPVKLQGKNIDKLYTILKTISEQYKIQVYSTKTGYSIKGVDLGSSNFITLQKPKVMMLVEGSVSPYEAGEVWHLFEQRMHMPIVKVPERIFNKVDLKRYNVIIMVAGKYNLLQKKEREKLKNWITNGNTLITTTSANLWIIKNKIVTENLVKKVVDSTTLRLKYADSRGVIGKQRIGGAILNIDLDLTHPIAYGYHDKNIPIYKNNTVFLVPSKNRFSTIAKYTENPHIDGYVTQENIDNYLTKSASIVASKVGAGRVIMFADNPNFRGAWYGTNKLFMNAVFFGSIVNIPK